MAMPATFSQGVLVDRALGYGNPVNPVIDAPRRRLLGPGHLARGGLAHLRPPHLSAAARRALMFQPRHVNRTQRQVAIEGTKSAGGRTVLMRI